MQQIQKQNKKRNRTRPSCLVNTRDCTLYNRKQLCLKNQTLSRKIYFQHKSSKNAGQHKSMRRDFSTEKYFCRIDTQWTHVQGLKSRAYFDKGLKAFVFVQEVLVEVAGFIVATAESSINSLHAFTIGSWELEQDLTGMNTQNNHRCDREKKKAINLIL